MLVVRVVLPTLLQLVTTSSLAVCDQYGAIMEVRGAHTTLLHT